MTSHQHRVTSKMSWKFTFIGGAVTLIAHLTLVSSESELTAEMTRRKRGELDPATCAEDFDIQVDKIIRTEESRDMGAKYLNEVDVGAREECLRLCCETEACDVFVFEEKSPGSCYLFNCGPPADFKCKFTRHTNFSSGVLALSRHLAELQDRVQLAKHEQDLASLRKSPISTVPPTTATPSPTTVRARPSPAVPVSAQRRCSPYQFECHGSGECIAIYNACDGVPQCADGSDEAAELLCPSAAPAEAPRAAHPRPEHSQPPPRESPEQMTQQKSSAPGAYLRPANEYAPPAPRWPHRLLQAQPPQLKPYEESGVSGVSSHIFNHKGGLLQDAESQMQQQYVPIESMQEPPPPWARRQWQQQPPMEPLSMSDRQMYHYGAEPAWKTVPVEQGAAAAARDRQGAGSAPELVDRDKMWAVPQANAMKPEPPMYVPAKTMPEMPMIYSNHQGTLRDSPKKGFGFAPKPIHSQYEPVDNRVEESPHNKLESENKNEDHKSNTTPKGNAKKEKEQDLSSGQKKSETSAVTENKENVHHDHFKMMENDDHEGLSERPPGAILLLILGVLMTTVMAVMLGCRLRLARRRMRRAGKSPFAHDADYLVNGMYL